MPVLLMARGDKEARDLLTKAIEARYGNRPPVIESLRMDFSGRVRTKIGPVQTWVPLELKAMFVLPKAMRWDFTAKPIGVPVRRGVESYDGTTLRSMRGNHAPNVIDNADHVKAMQMRLWAIAALLLTPLGDMFVELKAVDERTFQAKHMQLDVAVKVHLQQSDWIDSVSVDCLNVDSGKVQTFALRVEQEQVSLGDLLLPKKITASWDDEPAFEMEPAAVESNPSIPDHEFTLSQEANN